MTKSTSSMKGGAPKHPASIERIIERCAAPLGLQVHAQRTHERGATPQREKRRLPFAARVPEGHCTSAG